MLIVMGTMMPTAAVLLVICVTTIVISEKMSTARNRFLSRVRHWSGQPANRERVVRLIEHPEGITGEEWEADTCIRDGVASRGSTVAVPVKRGATPGR